MRLDSEAEKRRFCSAVKETDITKVSRDRHQQQSDEGGDKMNPYPDQIGLCPADYFRESAAFHIAALAA